MAIQSTDACAEPKDVRDITGTQLTDGELNAFIRAAHLIIENAVSASCNYSEELLCEIEIWLAAHLSTAAEPLVGTERIGSTYLSYVRNQSANAVGLNATPYGQHLRLLDTCGAISNAEKENLFFTVFTEYDDILSDASNL